MGSFVPRPRSTSSLSLPPSTPSFSLSEEEKKGGGGRAKERKLLPYKETLGQTRPPIDATWPVIGRLDPVHFDHWPITGIAIMESKSSFFFFQFLARSFLINDIITDVLRESFDISFYLASKKNLRRSFLYRQFLRDGQNFNDRSYE